MCTVLQFDLIYLNKKNMVRNSVLNCNMQFLNLSSSTFTVNIKLICCPHYIWKDRIKESTRISPLILFKYLADFRKIRYEHHVIPT
jgi:hypothetical protein